MSSPAGLGSQVSCPRAIAYLASSGRVRGEANEPVRKPLAQVMLSFVRRPNGGSPCGGRGATALPPFAVVPFFLFR